MIVAIDGPSGSGKSSVSTRIAKALDLVCLNTGMIYRGVGLHFHRNNIINESDYPKALKTILLRLSFENNVQKLFLGNEDVTDLLLQNEVGDMASTVSKNHDVREYVALIQSNIVCEKGLIAEGRDITTVIFPNAEHKFFLNASYAIRAERRFKQLGNSMTLSFRELVTSMYERDMQDMKRNLSPLKLDEGATYISSDNKTLDEVTQEIISVIKAHAKT